MNSQGNFQFTIHQMLLLTLNVALYAAFASKAPFLMITACSIFLAWIFGVGQKKPGRILLWLFLILIPLEHACSVLAFHTIGEIASGLYRLFLTANVLFLIMFLLGWRRSSYAMILLLAIMLIPYQLGLGLTWWFVHGEANRIVEHVEQEKRETGTFPKDLSGYEFGHERVKPQIYYRPNEDSFHVSYYIGTRSTSHWYDNGGSWMYYPD